MKKYIYLYYSCTNIAGSGVYKTNWNERIVIFIIIQEIQSPTWKRNTVYGHRSPKFMSLMLGLSSCSRMVECICVTSEEIKKLIFNKIFALCDFSGKQDIFMLTDLHWPHIFDEISCCANFVYDCRRIVWNGSRVIFDSLFQENLFENL